MADLRAAIIGYGLAGRFFHAPLIAAVEGLVVASVVTSSPERQAQVSREHPGARVLTSPAELWERAEDHDLVVVATPNDAHAPLAAEAIDRGLPVVVDKPLAITSGDAEALVSRSERASGLLTVFQNRRWDSDQLTLARLLAEDRLGTVFRYESRFERWRPSASSESWRDSTSPERGGGQLLDLGAHLVDQTLVLFGPVTHVYAEVDARRGAPGDDDAFVALRHAHDVISHLRASAITAAPGPRLRVLGTKAAFVVQELDGQENALRSGGRPDEVPDWGSQPESRWGRLVSAEKSAPVPGPTTDQYHATGSRPWPNPRMAPTSTNSARIRRPFITIRHLHICRLAVLVDLRLNDDVALRPNARDLTERRRAKAAELHIEVAGREGLTWFRRRHVRSPWDRRHRCGRLTTSAHTVSPPSRPQANEPATSRAR